MIQKIIIIFFLIVTTGFSNIEQFNTDIQNELSDDFKKFGITYIEDTNRIRFNSFALAYAPGQNNLNSTFKKSLEIIYPKYLKILLKYKKQIKKVYIKGYSSLENSKRDNPEDKYKLNLILSQERAELVYSYLQRLERNIPLKKEDKIWLNDTMSALGMSSSELIYDENGNEDKIKSRRIEIEVVFKKDTKSLLLDNQKIDTDNMYVDNNTTDTDLIDTNLTEPTRIVYLVDYVKRLLIENPTLAEKYNFLKSIQKDIEIAKATFRPTATLNFKRAHYFQSTSDKYTDTQSIDLTLRYNIFNGFKDINEKNINQYNYLSNKYLQEQVETDLIYSLTEAFITIQKQKAVLDLAKTNLEDYDNWIEKENIKFLNGMVSLKDYAKMQSRDTMQRMNFQELQRQYRDSVALFQKYLDFDINDIPYFEHLKPNSKYIDNKDIAYYDANRLSPFLKEANTNIRLYKEKLKKQKVNFYPTVDLVGKTMVADDDYESTPSINSKDTYISLEAKLEFYSGGKDQANEDKKRFEYRQKVKKRDEVSRDVRYKVDLAFNKYNLVLSKDELLTLLISKRENSLLGATYDYDFAKIDTNGLLDVVDSLYNAKKLYIENSYDMILIKYKILSNIGVIKNYILDDWIKE